MKARVRRMDLPEGRRALAVSDIHGNLPFLKALLDKAGFGPEDLLFVVGDFLEKGPESLATLRYLMELSRAGNVYTLLGNCDDLVFACADGEEGSEDGLYGYLIARPESTVHQMAAEHGFRLESRAGLPELRRLLRSEFRPELDFLRALPHIIDTPRFLFVHGGVPSEHGLEELDAWKCMKNDDFLHQDTHLGKWCVVGHWPVTLYHPRIPTARPLICREKRIISIDGGCVLKWDGQLNALILPEGTDGEFSYVSYDGLPTVTALDGQEESADSINIRWFENRVTVLSRGEEFSRCRHDASGREIDILNEYLMETGNVTRCEDSTDYRLPVAPGDALSVVRRTSRGLLAKKDGVTGWYLGRTEEG